MKEITLYGSIILVVALLANHYAELNVPLLNLIEDSVMGESDSEGLYEEDSANVFDYADIDVVPGDSQTCITTKKMAGDAKINIRTNLQRAKKEHDEDTISAMGDKLEMWRDRIRTDCAGG